MSARFYEQFVAIQYYVLLSVLNLGINNGHVLCQVGTAPVPIEKNG
jgi:hypothetical protein